MAKPASCANFSAVHHFEEQGVTRDTRPVYLNLVRIRLPVPGFISILHRVSGLLLVLATPLLLWLVQRSLAGPEGFAAVQQLLRSLPGQLAILALLWAVLHHLFAGLRHLLLDIDVGVDAPYYRQSAWLVLIAPPLLAVLLGALA